VELTFQHYCFGCGEMNPIGLKLKFTQDGEMVRTVFVPGENYQGYPGILHGGITSTILDEIMSHCLHRQGLNGLTARLEIRYRKSIPIGKPVTFEARMLKRKGSLVDLEARAILDDGQLAAEAQGRFMLMDKPREQESN